MLFAPIRRLVVVCSAVLLAGCNAVTYYGQAAQGHFALLAAARPIGEWLDDPATPADLKQRLARARDIRAYAAQALGLPDNRSYTEYADLRRPAAVWNVFATPELSLELKTWCYPVLGCAGYRGYFDRDAAEAMAAEQRAQGFDVNVAPVPAYSTLGWFSDPLLNTFIHYPDAELARLIFHELAHQITYVKDDTVFNESFATAVEREGVRRWLAAQGDESLRAAYAKFAQRREDFLALLLEHRRRLGAVFASKASDADKRALKAELFAELQQQYQRIRNDRWGGFAGYDRFFNQPLNSAHLAAIGAYNDLVPAFEAVLRKQRGDLPAFYDEVKRLGRLDKGERTARMQHLLPQVAQAD